MRAVETVALLLRNTPAVCRRSYIHPVVIEAYLRDDPPHAPATRKRRGLSPDEAALIALLSRPKRGPVRRPTDREPGKHPRPAPVVTRYPARPRPLTMRG